MPGGAPDGRRRAVSIWTKMKIRRQARIFEGRENDA
jgi:hypothetical protein